MINPWIIIGFIVVLAVTNAGSFLFGRDVEEGEQAQAQLDAYLAAETAAYLVAQVRIDLLSYAQGTHHYTLEMHLPDDSYPRLPYMPLVRRLKLVTPTAEDPLRRGTDGLFRAASGDVLPNDPNARVQSGVLEGSNVNPIETMVGMIQAARQFETQMRLLQTAESNDRSAGKLLGQQG